MINIAFEYMLLKLAIRYVDITQPEKNNITFFEKLKLFADNDFGIDKIKLFPFLITTGNGLQSRKALLNFFQNKFYPTSTGIFHLEISEYVDTNESTLFSFTQTKIGIKEIGKFSSCMDERIVIELIHSAEISVLNKSETEILFTAFGFIDKSIDFIHNQRLKRFAALPFEKLSSWSKRNMSYKIFNDKLKPTNLNSKVGEWFRQMIETEMFDFAPETL
jgi:hypothetical protein